MSKPSPSRTPRGASTPTPGPWVPARESGLRWRIQTAGDKGTLAYMTARPGAWLGNFSHAQIEANARLIAAAPDLLDALEELVDVLPCQNGCKPDDMTCATMRARAVIKKARGQ